MSEEIPQWSDEATDDYGYAAHWQIKGGRGASRRRYSKVPLEDFPYKDKLPGAFDGWDRGRDGVKYRWLASMLSNSVGHPWAKVHSEIMDRLNHEYTASQRHDILSVLDWYVEVNPMDVGDGQYVKSNGRPFTTGRAAWGNYLVHPKTGLLIRPKEAWTKIRFENHRNFSPSTIHDPTLYNQGHYYRKVRDVWYEIIIEHVPSRREAGAPKWETPQHSWHRRDEEDWLWKMNVVDVVLKRRIRSYDLHDLALTHGYKTYDDRLITHQQYADEMEKMYKTRYYANMPGMATIGERYIYAKAMRQLGKAELNRLGLSRPNLKVPDIVRKHK